MNLHRLKDALRVTGVVLILTALGFPVQRLHATDVEPDKWFPFNPANDSEPSVIGMEGWIEAPAGRRGGVRMVEDHFGFEDGTRVKFWGVNNGISNFMENRKPRSREQMRAFARHYRKYGVNAVRQHKFAENAYGLLGNSVLEFVPQRLDAFDFYNSELKRNGIYYGFSHVFHLRLQPGDRDKVLAFDEIDSTIGFKFARDIQDVHIEQTVRLLNHRNPHTGLRYAEDPALAFVEMHNEDNLFWPIVQTKVNKSPTYRKLFCEMFSDWLIAEYRSHDGLVKAWGANALNAEKIVQNEHLDQRNICPVANCFSLMWWLDNRPELRQRALDTARFLYEVQDEFYVRYEKAIRDTGYQGPIVGSCWQAGEGMTHYYNLLSDAKVGIIDRHNYWGGKRQGRGRSMLASPGSGLLGVGLQQVTGRPFAFSEWISVYPNEWAAECAPIIAAYGMGLQDWDASYQFFSGQGAFHHKALGHAWCVQLPTQIGLYPALARMIYRRDLTPGPVVSTRHVHVNGFGQSETIGFDEGVKQEGDFKEFTGGFQAALAVGKVHVNFTDEPQPTQPFDLAPHRTGDTLESVTGQLAWTTNEDHGHFAIDTQGTQAVVGFAQGERFVLTDLTIEPASPFCVLFVTALEPDTTIANSRRLLVTVVARIRNTGMRFNEAGTEVIQKGRSPMLLEPVKAGITLRRPGTPTVHLLDHDGRRTGRTQSIRDGHIEINGATDHALYYEIIYPE